MALSEKAKQGLRGGIPNVTGQNEMIVVGDYVDDNKASISAVLAAQVGQAVDAALSVSTEISDKITVTVNLKDENGDAITAITKVDVFLFEDALGVAITAATYTTVGLYTSAGGVLVEVVASKAYQVIPNIVDGGGSFGFELTLNDPAADTSYLGVLLPNGKMVISGAITHADDS